MTNLIEATLEKLVKCDHFKQNTAGRPDVRLEQVALVVDELRTHVVERAHKRKHLLHLVDWVNIPGQAQVAQFDVGTVQKYVS